MEKPINQRIKFLLESLSLSARDFSRAVGVPDNNTQNYLEPRFAQPKVEYLEKVVLHFESINPIWLLTGKGEPFLPPTDNTQIDDIQSQKIFYRSPIVGKNSGTANQQQHKGGTPALHDDKMKLALAEKEIEHLQAQLASANALLASKEELITLLRASYNRPN